MESHEVYWVGIAKGDSIGSPRSEVSERSIGLSSKHEGVC